MSREAVEATALRLVSAGEITVAGGGYVHGGHLVAGELAQALVRLRAAGCLAVGARGPGGHRPVRIVAGAAARLGALPEAPDAGGAGRGTVRR